MSEAERINELTARCVNAEAKFAALQTRFNELLGAADNYLNGSITKMTFECSVDGAKVGDIRAKQPAGEKGEKGG